MNSKCELEIGDVVTRSVDYKSREEWLSREFGVVGEIRLRWFDALPKYIVKWPNGTSETYSRGEIAYVKDKDLMIIEAEDIVRKLQPKVPSFIERTELDISDLETFDRAVHLLKQFGEPVDKILGFYECNVQGNTAVRWYDIYFENDGDLYIYSSHYAS